MSYRMIESAPQRVLETANLIKISNPSERINEVVAHIFHLWQN